MFLIYDFIFFVYAIIYLPVLLLKGKGHGGFLMRFGIFSAHLKNALGKQRNIWLHAVSVGEVMAVGGLIKELKKKFPNDQIVLSVTTKSGHELACRLLGNQVLVIWSPLDFSFVVRAFASAIAPRIYIAAETELWPNLFRTLSKSKVPIILVNGRISSQAFGRYRMIRLLLKNILKQVDIFCMQSQTDADRVRLLGAPHERVYVVGNIKFDELSESKPLELKSFGFHLEEELWICGSTHPGEEDIVLEIFGKIRSRYPRLRLVIAPRHTERVGEITKLVIQFGLTPVLFSKIHDARIDSNAVVIVDTIGHLRSLYSLATLVFIGKSLTVGGGHNIIEPAYFSKPIVVGPLMENFKDIVAIFLEHDAILQVQNADQLQQAVEKFLKDSHYRNELGQRARAVISKNQGATQKTLRYIEKLVNTSLI